MRKLHLLSVLAIVLSSVFFFNAAQPTQAQSECSGPFTIGVSNSFVGSEWRTQMIQNIENVVAEFNAAGIEVNLVIESADTDVAGQQQQIQNLVNRGVDAIIINPGDQAALNFDLEEAAAQGIVVIAVDQEIGAQGVYNVVIDQTEWARISARWLAEKLNGQGDIVVIEGFVGHPANEARMAGALEVFAQYPGINIVGRESGGWDQATGQQVMSDFLASLPNIDGVWTQDGMAFGVLTAIRTANPASWPVVSGEARAGYLQLWHDVLAEQPDFSSIGVVNPPGVGADGVRVAMEILCGNTVDASQLQGPFGNTLYVPIPYAVTDEDFASYYQQFGSFPASYTLDGFITQEQAAAFMAEDDGPVISGSAFAQNPRVAELAGMCSGPFTIGVSNSFVGSEWRTQMIQNIENVVAEFNAAGIEVNLVIESADTDVAGQQQQIQNLVNRGVDAIIINPGDQAALNFDLEEAAAQGIVVIAVDQEIGAQGVYNVVIDQTEWARISARWLAEKLNGQGDIVVIEGFVGHPANEARMAGALEVFAQYPGINIVGRESGGWDQATGQQVMSDFLASLPNIDGVWTQDGMAFGVLTAIRTANPASWPVVSGEARAGYLQLWHDVLAEQPDFSSIGVVNPPGVGADGVRVAMEILCGNTVDASQLQGPFGNTLYVPIPYAVTDEDFASYYQQFGSFPASYTLDGFITQEQAAAFME